MTVLRVLLPAVAMGFGGFLGGVVGHYIRPVSAPPVFESASWSCQSRPERLPQYVPIEAAMEYPSLMRETMVYTARGCLAQASCRAAQDSSQLALLEVLAR